MFRIIGVLLLLSNLMFAQKVNLQGTIYDFTTSKPLPSANVILKTLNRGTVSDANGKFQFPDLPKGIYDLVVSYVGYAKFSKRVILTKNLSLRIELKPVSIELKRTIVKGKQAILGETPVAFTNVDSREIQTDLGARYVTSVLESSPGVFIDEEGSGFGDSKLSIRGFNQTEISVMINGVPMNNPENGEVYWTNWADLSDVVDLIQVQRGLSVSPYSVSSIGGTVNIITRNGFQGRHSLKVKSEIASGNFKKGSLSFISGLGNFARVVGLISYADWKGYAEQTWAKMLTYYFSFAFNWDRNLLEIQLMGSPQKHGQRTSPQLISTWNRYGLKYNADWGMLNGKPLNLRDNEFNKPSITINHNWQASKNLTFSNSIYLSYGKGGGHVPPWGGLPKDSTGRIDFQSVWRNNSKNIDSNFSPTLHRSTTALRFTVHKHKWLSFFSNIKYVRNNFNYYFGLNGKLYKAENYSTIGNLLGGDYYIGSGNVNDNPQKLLKVGDKVDYDADSFVREFGGFAQIEFNSSKINYYLNTSLSRTSYDRIDYFNYRPNEKGRETGWKYFTNYTLKTGVSFHIDKNAGLFFNVGMFSRAPLSMNVYNYFNELYKDVKNEKVFSVEGGSSFKNKLFNIDLDFYYTFWKDKAMIYAYSPPNSYSYYYMNIYGAKALHKGVELDGSLNLNRSLILKGSASLSMNKWLNDVSAILRPEGTTKDEIFFDAKLKNLYIGNSPMTKIFVGLVFKKSLNETIKFYFNPHFYFFGRRFAQFEPISRNDEEGSGQSWRVPDYNKIDLHTGLVFELKSAMVKKIKVNLNVFNLLNKKNIIQAFDGATHDALTARVWFNRERWYDFSITAEI